MVVEDATGHLARNSSNWPEARSFRRATAITGDLRSTEDDQGLKTWPADPPRRDAVPLAVDRDYFDTTGPGY